MYISSSSLMVIKNFTKYENSDAEEIIKIALNCVSINYLVEFEKKVKNSTVKSNTNILNVENPEYEGSLNKIEADDKEKIIFFNTSQKDKLLSLIKIIKNKLSS